MTKTWVGSTSSWNTASNWSPSGVPTSTDDVVFSHLSHISVTADTNIDVASITVGATYAGTVDFADSGYSHRIRGNATFSSSFGTVDCGISTIQVDGNFVNSAQASWLRGTSTLILAGTGVTFNGSGRQFYNLTIDGTVTNACSSTPNVYSTFTINSSKTFTVPNSTYFNTTTGASVNVNGTLTINDTSTSNCRFTGATVTIGGTGSLSGTGRANLINCTFYHTSGGTVDVATLSFQRNSTVSGGTYNSNSVVFDSTVDATATLGTAYGQTLTFNGAVSFQHDFSTYNTTTIRTDTYNPNIVVYGYVNFAPWYGTVAWVKGTGTFTLAGTSTQYINLYTTGLTGSLDSLVINKGSDSAQVVFNGSSLQVASFTGTRGRFNLAGNTIYVDSTLDINGSTGFAFHNGGTSGTDADYSMNNGKFDVNGGSVYLDGTLGTHLEIHDLDFDLADGVLGTATYCDVQDSIVTYVTAPMDASDTSNTEIGGVNTGWLFPGPTVTVSCTLGDIDIVGFAATVEVSITDVSAILTVEANNCSIYKEVSLTYSSSVSVPVCGGSSWYPDGMSPGPGYVGDFTIEVEYPYILYAVNAETPTGGEVLYLATDYTTWTIDSIWIDRGDGLEPYLDTWEWDEFGVNNGDCLILTDELTTYPITQTATLHYRMFVDSSGETGIPLNVVLFHMTPPDYSGEQSVSVGDAGVAAFPTPLQRTNTTDMSIHFGYGDCVATVETIDSFGNPVSYNSSPFSFHYFGMCHCDINNQPDISQDGLGIDYYPCPENPGTCDDAEVTITVYSEGNVISCEVGYVIINGNNIDIVSGANITATQGEVIITGSNPVVGAGTTISPNFGYVGVTGLDATVNATSPTSVEVSVTTGTVDIGGYYPTVTAESSISVTLGEIDIGGYYADIGTGTIISATLGQVDIGGYYVGLSAATNISVSTGAVDIGGYFPTVVVLVPIDVDATNGAVDIGGYYTAISVGTSLTTDLGAVDIGGYFPTVTVEVNINVGLGEVLIGGYNPSMSVGTSFQADNGAVDIGGYNPSISVGTSFTTTLGEVDIGGYNPSISVGTSFTTTLGSVDIGGYNPSISVGSSYFPTSVDVAIGGYNPAISVGTSIFTNPVGVEIGGYNTSVSVGTSIFPAAGTVDIGGYYTGVSVGTTVSALYKSIYLEGNNAELSVGTDIYPTNKNVDIVGNHADVGIGEVIPASYVDVAISGYPVEIAGGTLVSCNSINILIQGYDVVVGEGINVDAQTHDTVIAGGSLFVSVGTDIDSTYSSVDISGTSPDISVGSTVICDFSAVNIEGFDVEIDATAGINCNTGNVTIGGYNAGVSNANDIECDSGELLIGGYDAEVIVTTLIEAANKNINIVGYNPLLGIGAGIFPGAGSVLIDGYNSVVSASSPHIEVDCIVGGVYINGNFSRVQAAHLGCIGEVIEFDSLARLTVRNQSGASTSIPKSSQPSTQINKTSSPTTNVSKQSGASNRISRDSL